MYELIDTDTRAVVGTAATEAEALALNPSYLPGDCVPGAETWDEVVKVAAQHIDGVPGVMQGYATQRRPVSPAEASTLGPDGMLSSQELAALSADELSAEWSRALAWQFRASGEEADLARNYAREVRAYADQAQAAE